MPNFQTATIIKHEVPAAKFHDIIFETQEPLTYFPGQFITVKITDNKLNSYSIAGKVGERQYGLLVDSTPGGLGSQYFESLKVGDTISFLGPLGHLKFNSNDGSRHHIFLATGCGIAPIKHMVETALKEQGCQKPITLYFGLRYKDDIFWDYYFNELAQQYPNFTYKLCLSRPDETWKGASGHITDLLKEDFKDASHCSAYICGNLKMAQEAKEILASLNCPNERVYAEMYG
ncbi:MAG: FAD-binding oxidoreductase [Patescibacteria group bacterium]|jgi:CDP-4-dehydro-6-deoxyglucose reductase